MVANYTTTISVTKTVGEIETLLVKLGVLHIGKSYENGEIIALTFAIEREGVLLNFRLPANYKEAFLLLKREKLSPKFKTEAQALRVAWRTLKYWVEAQIDMLALRMVELTEVFLPYLLLDSGQTLFESIKNQNFKLLN